MGRGPNAISSLAAPEDFPAHNGNVNCIKIGQKSSGVLVTGGDDKKVNLWTIGAQTKALVRRDLPNDEAIHPYACRGPHCMAGGCTCWEVGATGMHGCMGPLQCLHGRDVCTCCVHEQCMHGVMLPCAPAMLFFMGARCNMR